MSSRLIGGIAFVMAGCAGAGPKVPPAPEPPAAPGHADGAEAAPAAAMPILIELWFHDASVPAPDHQSFYISVTAHSIRRVVDSYGDVIRDQTAPLSSAQFADVVAALSTYGLVERQAEPSAPGCTGGTSHALAVTYPDRESPRLSVEHCGGTDVGTLAGDVRGFAAALSALLPSVLASMP